MQNKKFLIIIGIFAVLVIFVFFFWQKGEPEPPPVPIEETVALVNGEKILKDDFERLLGAQEYYLTNIYPEIAQQTVPEDFFLYLRKVVLENLIQEALLTQYLEERGITISNEEARQYIKESIVDENWEGDWQAYEEALKTRYNNTIENVIQTVRRDLLFQKILEVENLAPGDFEEWYFELREQSEVSINIDL